MQFHEGSYERNMAQNGRLHFAGPGGAPDRRALKAPEGQMTQIYSCTLRLEAKKVDNNSCTLRLEAKKVDNRSCALRLEVK